MAVKNSEQSIIDVIPIMKGQAKSSLSYFTKDKFEVGNFIKIPLRKGVSQGIVVGVRSAELARSEVRRANFMLKKVSKSDSKFSLSSDFIKAAELTAGYYATTTGNILGTVIPKIILENPSLISGDFSHTQNKTKKTETLLVQMDDDDRFREYKSIIRECFSKKCSVQFCVPTHEDALRAFDHLSRGIEKYAYVTSKQTPAGLKKMLAKARSESHPIVFITTYSYLVFDRPDFQTIIFERENSRSYRTLSRPYIHIKVFLEFLSQVSGRRLIMGDSVLSLETLWLEKQEEYADLSPLRWRIVRESKSHLIDMKKGGASVANKDSKSFRVFSTELENLIIKAVDEKNKIFLFGVRKGLSPSTTCGDCGSILSCINCRAPMVLHERGQHKERIYICHACGAHRSSQTLCDNCNSWKLVPLGIGVDRIKNEVEKLVPSANIFTLDKDSAPTSARAKKIAQEFASQKGGVLIGTELAFLYLEKIPYSGIVSLDALFSIPDFGINERIFYLTSRLREITTKEIIVQTRNIGQEVLALANEGNVLDFYRKEIEEREALLYPPFSVFIKVTTTGTSSDIDTKAVELRRLFIEYNPDFIRFRSSTPGFFTLSMIIRMARIHWPDPVLREKLLLLTPDFLIKVDPESIL